MSRITREKKTVEIMIKIYCSGHHLVSNDICLECKKIVHYAHARLDKCKYSNQKPDCNSCQTHCYKKDMREQIKIIMKYSGPKMFLPHPYLSLMHFIDKIVGTLFKYK